LAAIDLDVRYEPARSRPRNVVRFILAIPHMVIAGAWGHLMGAIAIIQWFHILFTGRRSPGLWRMMNQYMDYGTRVNAYTLHLYDEYPKFIDDPEERWVWYRHEYEEPADRLTTGLRLIWAIPAMFMLIPFGIAACAVVLFTWFGILFTGRQDEGVHRFLVKALRYFQNTGAYLYLMTDEYPTWGGGAPASPVVWPALDAPGVGDPRAGA